MKKDFYIVLAGQIISLFGNAVLRFALPLYLLNETGSAALFGVVSACSFLPMILLSPVGGILADRLNKRNIMVALDFGMAVLVTVFQLMLGRMNLIALLLIMMILLYAIQGTYQPVVQASVPVLVQAKQLMQGNALVNLVQSLSGLAGPVAGGALYSFFGIRPILVISAVCFLGASIMELFLHIPYTKNKSTEGLWKTGMRDIRESFSFMRDTCPEIMKVSLILSGFNLVLSTCIIIGLPVVITRHLGYSAAVGNRMYGYMEGIMGAGGLTGGILAGPLARKMKPQDITKIVAACAFLLLPVGSGFLFGMSSSVIYLIMAVCNFLMMLMAALASILVMSYLQIITPNEILGKVISCAMCVIMLAQPLGQAIYGILFQKFGGTPQYIFFLSAAATAFVAWLSGKPFEKIEALLAA